MSAQPALAGFEPPPAQTPALDVDALPMFAVRGLVEGRATVRTDAGGRVLLDLLLRQHAEHHPRAVPLHVVYPWPDAGSVAATLERATHFAGQLMEGADVLIRGRGLEIRNHRGHEVLRVMRCDNVVLFGALVGGATS